MATAFLAIAIGNELTFDERPGTISIGYDSHNRLYCQLLALKFSLITFSTCN